MTTEGSPPGQRWRLALLVALVVVVVTGYISLAVVRLSRSDGSPGAGWVRVGSVEDVRAQGVVFLPELPGYVVAEPPRTPITLLARSPQLGERIVYCRSSGWFEDPLHGSKFDRLGNYALGPAPRGLDRFATIVRDGVVWVNPSEITLGPPRGGHVSKPAGPFCTARG